MKNIFLLAMTVILFTACQTTQKQRYTQQSAEIETVKKHIDNYNNKSYDTTVFADTSKSFFNTADNPLSIEDLIAYHKANDANYTSRGFTGEDPEFEMVITDDGETWVNCWLDWKCTLKGNGKVFEMPVHLTYRFIDGKIVREVGMWDPTEIVMSLQEIEAEKNMSPEEKTIKASMDAVVKAWNTHDKDLFMSTLSDNVVRTENGNVIASSSAEYISNLVDVYRGAFPDFKVTLNDYNIVGNKVHINWTCTGTNTKPFLDNPATNKSIKTHGHSIWTIDGNGKFSREDAYYDNLTVFTQLGYSQPSL